MNKVKRTLILGLPLIALSACGGGDTEDRLGIADPVMRFVHASALTPNLTLYRNDVARADVSNVSYKSASNYLYTDSGTAQWQVKTNILSVSFGNISIDAKRGNRYTIVAFPLSVTETLLYEIRDPYNKSVSSDRAKLRIVNGSFNADNIDLYINSIGTDISLAGVVPLISNTSYKTAGPASGNNSVDIDSGNYQLSITVAGSKTILSKGLISVEKNKDILLVTLPDSLFPTAVRTLIKVDGDAGSKELPAS